MARDIQFGGRGRLFRCPPGARAGYSGGVQSFQCLDQACLPPVQHMVVGQRAGIDGRDRQGRHIRRVHPVIDAFWFRFGGRGDRGFQIDDAQIAAAIGVLGQQVAPDVVIARPAGNRAVEPLGQPHIALGRSHVILVYPRVERVRQYLVYAPPQHDVTGKKQAYRMIAGLHSSDSGAR